MKSLIFDQKTHQNLDFQLKNLKNQKINFWGQNRRKLCFWGQNIENYQKTAKSLIFDQEKSKLDFSLKKSQKTN